MLLLTSLICMFSGCAGSLPALSQTQQPISDSSSQKASENFFVLFFTASWSKEARESQPAVKRAIERFGNSVRLVTTSVDDPRNDAFVKAVGVRDLPAAIIVSRSGERIKTLVGTSEC